MKLENDFERIATNKGNNSFITELWGLMHTHKKYWLMPIVIVLLLFGVFVFLAGTAAAPFIYTLF